MATEKNKPGAKKKEINWQVVDNYLMAGCDGTEVAAAIGLKSADTLYNRCKEDHNLDFSAYKQLKASKGDALLRAAQYKKAVQEGDNTMLVWLGKNRLEQTDKKQLDHLNNGSEFKTVTIFKLPDNGRDGSKDD